MIDDKSWRVRYMFVENIVGIMKSMNYNQSADVQQSFLESMVNLLRDNEQEVRTIAAEKLRDFAAALNEDGRDSVILSHLLEPIQSLAHDQCQHVRTALAGIVMGIAPLIGNKYTNENLLPLYLHLLKDECSDVRLNIIKNIHQLNQVMSIDQLMNSILPAVVELAQDGKWRVRLAIIEHMPLLAEQLGRDIFEQKLSDLVLGWLSDSVYAIREQACKNVTKLAKYFGQSWIQSCLTPHLRQLSSEASYLRRLTTIFAVNNLVEILNGAQISQIVLPILQQSSKDDVPNVRFNVAKSFKLIRECLSKNNEDLEGSDIAMKTKECLCVLREDSDPDVKFYAEDSWRDWEVNCGKVFAE
jgi:serine/threonine-protein phosphatase 2A regulatory subunit A